MKPTKVAGTSTQILLSKFCGKNDVITPIGSKPQNYFPKNSGGFHSHMYIQAISRKTTSNIFNSYYKFMTVRNPWDRIVSQFWWWFGGAGRAMQTFGKFNPNKKQPEEEEIIKAFKAWFQKGSNIPSLYCWSHIKDVCVLNDFIRYENLEEDTLRILNKLRIDATDISYPKEKSKFRLSAKHYTEYYDEETRQIVAEKFKKDIEYFEYEFGG